MYEADHVLIGAGSGLSAAAGLDYGGAEFKQEFHEWIERYGFEDLYSSSFYPFPTEEERWAYWARHIWFTRYRVKGMELYHQLFDLVKDKNYFVITTNVDHMFQKAGLDKKRLFYTQGDYGLFQSVNPDIRETIDNEDWVMKAMEAQGFVKDEVGVFQVPENGTLSMSIPTELIPKCGIDGSDVVMNLRSDDSFLEDKFWSAASGAYSDFLHRHENLHVLYLELGVGANTPVIIKYPFWQMTLANEKTVYACINYGEAFCPGEIEDRSICIDGDIGEILEELDRYADAI